MSNVIKGGWNDTSGKQGNNTSGNPPGGDDVEARLAKLETHFEYIRRDLDEVAVDVKEIHTDLTSIKRRMAYLAGGSVVVLGILAWIANNRFDQILHLLAK
ncbi:hypothetical protein D9M68_138710 [compost metagenome]